MTQMKYVAADYDEMIKLEGYIQAGCKLNYEENIRLIDLQKWFYGDGKPFLPKQTYNKP